MMKIDFPKEEIKTLKKQTEIITTRVSREYSKYHVGDEVQTPWGKSYIILSEQKIDNVKKHPYYSALSQDQIQLLSKYKKIKILTLKRTKKS